MIHYVTTQGVGQPWVVNELAVVDQAGIPFVLNAMRRPEQKLFESAWASRLHDSTVFMYPLPKLGMILSIVAAPFLFGRRFMAALGNAVFGERESIRVRLATLAHLFVACHWARKVRRQVVSHVHAQWAHSSGSIAMYGAQLLDVSFSFTGHAADLFRNRSALKDKIRSAEFIVCISSFHRDFFLEHGAHADQLVIVYCGINTRLFVPRPAKPVGNAPFRVLSAGRLVEKKGFEYLVDACDIMSRAGHAFECVIAGSGPLEEELRARIERKGLAGRVTVTGLPLLQEAIPAYMHDGDVFALACVWAKDNDVDGLPQMTMEAMACGVPVVTTRLVGNPDLVVHEETGLLVAPNSAVELAAAIVRLMENPEESRRLAEAGRRRILERFEIVRALEPLVERYRVKAGCSKGTGCEPRERPESAKPEEALTRT